MPDHPKTYTVPASVKALSELSLHNPNSIDEIRFESGSQIERFEAHAFSLCLSLKSLCVPASVEFIGARCFVKPEARCFTSKLETITFEAGSKLREIADLAFYGCDSLRAISLPASVAVFSGASVADSGVRKISVEAGNLFFRVSGDAIVDAEARLLVRCVGRPKTFAVADTIECLGVSSFEGCRLLRAVVFGLANRLNAIGDDVFRGCSRLESFSVPVGVASIGRDCFRHCGGLRSISFCAPSTLAQIGEGAFSFCGQIERLELPASVESIGGRCFFDCGSLAEVEFAPGSKLTEIEWRAFASCSSLESLCVPSSVERVGRDCFYLSWSLSTLAFCCPVHLLELLGLPPGGPEVMEIPDSVEALCFESCHSRHLEFGRDSKLARITAIGCRAFVQLSSASLARVRRALEFSDGGADAISPEEIFEARRESAL